MNTARHSRRATRALQALAEQDPALGALSLWCAHRDAETGDAPACSDARSIRYGPGFERLAPHEQVGLAAHHVLHVAFRHAPRMQALALRLGGAFDAALFQIAADALVNETLAQAGHALPRPAVLLSELMWEALGDAAGGRDALTRLDAERLYLRLAAASGGGGGQGGDAGQAEAGARDAARRAHAYAARMGFVPDMQPGPGDEDDRDDAMEAADWQARVARALEAGRLAGRGIGAAGLRLADLPATRTPWERLLRGLLARAVTDQPRPAHNRPSRRWLAADSDARTRGAPTPGFEPGRARTHRRPRIAVCLDCSSSVEAGLFARFAAELCAISRRSGAEIHVLLFDEALRATHRLPDTGAEAALRALHLPQGGGTDFAPPVAAAAALEPSIIVVLSDLQGPFGPPPRAVPVLWAVTGAPRPPHAPFGTLLDLDA